VTGSITFSADHPPVRNIKTTPSVPRRVRNVVLAVYTPFTAICTDAQQRESLASMTRGEGDVAGSISLVAIRSYVILLKQLAPHHK
jgi:hypothetical protein